MWLLRVGLFLGLLVSSWVAGTIPDLAPVSSVSLGTWGPWLQLPIPSPALAVPLLEPLAVSSARHVTPQNP